MALKAVLFDWDGTLFDSTKACYEVYREILPKFGVPHFSFQEFKETFLADYKRFYLSKGIPEKKLGEVDDAWRQAFAEREDGLGLFPFSQGMLTSLYNGDLKLGLVSNGDGYRVREELAKHEVMDVFQCVVTKDEANAFKPSPEGINFALKALNARPSEAIYIGDMAEDVIAGKKAGVRTAGVLTGVHSKSRMEKEKPDHLFENASGILSLTHRKKSIQ